MPAGAETLAAAVLLGAVHALAGPLSPSGGGSRSRWLSFAGGVAVGYVFVHLLPELARMAGSVAEEFRVEEAIFAVALLGLVVFYGLERWARASREASAEGEEPCTPPRVFWLHLATFTVYNALVGYLLPEQRAEDSLWLFTLAMALHFLVNDDGLRRHHRHRYDRVGRWVLAAAVAVGVGLGLTVPEGDLAPALVMAFLAGGVILNTLKEEVPEERESRFGAFVAGAAGYAALLLALG